MNRKMIPLFAGAVFLAVSCTGDFKKDYSVEKHAVTGVTLDVSSQTLLSGYDVTLTATIEPPDAYNKELWWASDNPDVATVLGGTVTGKSAGTATITVTTQSGEKTASCVVTVPTVLVEGVSITKELTLVVGDPNYALTYVTEPLHATNRGVTWKTNRPNVAEVDENGVVTPLSTGIANITVTTEDGKYNAFCTVTVLENLLVNPGFELPTRITNLVPQTWQVVPSPWFTAYTAAHPSFTPAAMMPSTSVTRASILVPAYADFFKPNGSGSFFLKSFTGSWMGMMGDRTTSKEGVTAGIFQEVPVGGGFYKIRATIGFRCDNAASSIKNWESIKILNADPNGTTLLGTDGKPIEALIDTRDIKLYNNRPSCVVEVDEIVEIPVGVTQVRFQLDQRSFQAPYTAPVMIFDNILFARMP